MSLNFREIDQVLKELNLEGARIDRINQPDRFSLYLETWNPGRKQKILIGLHNRAVRISRTQVKQKFPDKPPRFAQLLRARIKGGYIQSLTQPEGERLILFKIICRGDNYNLWIRLWSGNPNILLTDNDQKIVDVLFRKPESGEIQGQHFLPDLKALSHAGQKSQRIREIRDYSRFSDFCALVDHLYNSGNTDAFLEREKQQCTGSLRKKIKSKKSHLVKLKAKEELYTRYQDEKNRGELIQANIWRLKKGDTRLEAEDFSTGQKISIELKEELTPVENCELFFKRYRKYKKGLAVLQEEMHRIEAELSSLEKDYSAVENCETLEDLEKLRIDYQADRSEEKTSKPSAGLLFQSGDFHILVGRNSRENDTLLRKQAKGNDLWLHVRDYPGGYVFIKSRKGKTIPLETLLDAANLALLYSSGKKGVSADVHYTEVKNLRRMKGGKTGQVIVSRDRNLFVQFDEKRIRKLQGKSSLESPGGNPDN